MAIKHPLAEDLIRANKLIHMLKADASRILFPVLGAVEELQIDVYSDASWGNLSDGPVQKAMLYYYQAKVNDAVRYHGQAIKFTGKCKVHCLLRHCQLLMQLMNLSTLGIC